MPLPGTKFSASIGRTLEESAAGVRHGFIQSATAGAIRDNNGTVTFEPEFDEKAGTINRQHVHVIEGGQQTAFAPPELNPVPKRKRFGGPDYRDPQLDAKGEVP
jgi:hypothetical protein